ncbi:MAG: hypothetical protein NVSMB25_17110 [Thermoleophilaceae bacterium]
MSQTRYFKFRSRPEAVAAARRALAGFEHLLALSVFYDASLCVSELVTNAVLHASAGADAELELRVDINGDLLVVAVLDRGQGFVPDQPSLGDETGGWGLFIVDRLSDRWGVDHDGGTRVWFEMAVRAEQEAGALRRRSPDSEPRRRDRDEDDGTAAAGWANMRLRLRPHATR